MRGVRQRGAPRHRSTEAGYVHLRGYKWDNQFQMIFWSCGDWVLDPQWGDFYIPCCQWCNFHFRDHGRSASATTAKWYAGASTASAADRSGTDRAEVSDQSTGSCRCSIWAGSSRDSASDRASCPRSCSTSSTGIPTRESDESGAHRTDCTDFATGATDTTTADPSHCTGDLWVATAGATKCDQCDWSAAAAAGRAQSPRAWVSATSTSGWQFHQSPVHPATGSGQAANGAAGSAGGGGAPQLGQVPPFPGVGGTVGNQWKSWICWAKLLLYNQTLPTNLNQALVQGLGTWKNI